MVILTDVHNFTANEDKIQVYDFFQKIWKWLNLLNSVPFYIRTIHRAKSMIPQLVEHRTSNPKSWVWIPPEPLNFSIIQLVIISVSYHHWCLFHSWRKHLQIMFTFEFDHFDWLSQFQSEWKQTSKLVDFKISANVWVCGFGQNLKMTKISEFCSIHQENTCKSSWHSNLVIFTKFHSFTVNEAKLQNYSIFKVSTKVQVCELGQNLIM